MELIVAVSVCNMEQIVTVQVVIWNKLSQYKFVPVIWNELSQYEFVIWNELSQYEFVIWNKLSQYEL